MFNLFLMWITNAMHCWLFKIVFFFSYKSLFSIITISYTPKWKNSLKLILLLTEQVEEKR